MNYGFVRVGTAIPPVKVADCMYNVEEMLPIISEAEKSDTEIIVFPELGITSYCCGDLYRQQTLLNGVEKALQKILSATKNFEIIIIAGAPIASKGILFNCAIVMWHGEIIGIVPKTYIPNNDGLLEKKWFTSYKNQPEETEITICDKKININKLQLFHTPKFTFGIEIGEDLWAPIPPSSIQTIHGAEIIFNLSATPETVGRNSYLKELCRQQSARCINGYVYSGCGFGESSGDSVFTGNALIIENGKILKESERFSLKSQLIISEIDVEKIRHERMKNNLFADLCYDYKNLKITHIRVNQKTVPLKKLIRKYDKNPFIPQNGQLTDRCNEILNIQASGLAKRIQHTHATTCIIGISGGLDSTLALLATVLAFDMLNKPHTQIIAITMPGFGTTDRTYNNAIELMRALGVTIREIPIKEACIQHFKDIEHNIEHHDTTYENSQARERTQILMDIANKMNGLVIGTGDLSELALGWATYNGDHMSMYSINASIPKTLIKHLIYLIAQKSDNKKIQDTLIDIVNTPISPELIPADNDGNIKQKTEDLVGPYELHDFFLYHTLRNGFTPSKIYFLAQETFKDTYTNTTIKKWLTTFCHRFFTQQFKRTCMPDGPKVGSCSLSPRGDWNMPTDASNTLWINICENLED